MLHLLVDTSTWLDLARRRDGQRWIVALRVLILNGDIELLVPAVVLEEFDRNRERVEREFSRARMVARWSELLREHLR